MTFEELTPEEQERTRGFILLALDELGVTPPPRALAHLFTGYTVEQAQQRDRDAREHRKNPPEKPPKPDYWLVYLKFWERALYFSSGVSAAIWETAERLKHIYDPERRKAVIDAEVQHYFSEHPNEDKTRARVDFF